MIVIPISDRLRRLRELMADSRYRIDAYLVPMDDEHQSEYVAPHDARVRFISGFSGSAGQCGLFELCGQVTGRGHRGGVTVLGH